MNLHQLPVVTSPFEVTDKSGRRHPCGPDRIINYFSNGVPIVASWHWRMSYVDDIAGSPNCYEESLPEMKIEKSNKLFCDS